MIYGQKDSLPVPSAEYAGQCYEDSNSRNRLASITGCATSLYYNPAYIKDGKPVGYDDDYFECAERLDGIPPNESELRRCMDEKDWVSTSTVVVPL